MLDTTKAIHATLRSLGERLGFEATREVGDSLLRFRLDGEYQPRVDLMWSLHLHEPQRQALALALDRETPDVTHLPVVGVEVEGSQPTTKTLGADLANLATLGVPLGLLVVSERGEKNIFRRAVRVVRGFRRAFGERPVLALEASWLDDLPTFMAPRQAPSLHCRYGKPGGGETQGWLIRTRAHLRALGEAAGFVVIENFTPLALGVEFAHVRNRTARPLMFTADPCRGTRAEVRTSSDYFTDCEIDLAWLLPLPGGLRTFLEYIAGRDSGMAEDGFVFPELWEYLTVAAFELETQASKHAGGALLNVGAHSVVGIVLTPDAKQALRLDAALRTYRPMLGLRHVFVRHVS